MRRWWVATAFPALAARDQRGPPFLAYRHLGDAMASVLPVGMLGIYPSASSQEQGGAEVIVSLPVDQCFKMLPEKRFQGVWLDEFEGSRFIEGVRDVRTSKAALRRGLAARGANDEWLSWAGTKRPGLLPRSSNARLIAIDFMGRRTAYSGQYGHMGMSSSEVLVDRVISARVIYEASTPYLEDELVPR